jgi:hypothetical protein
LVHIAGRRLAKEPVLQPSEIMMSTFLRIMLVALALVSGVSAVAARPMQDTAASSNDEFNNNSSGGKGYWDKVEREGN